MKALPTSVALFILLIICIIINAFFINSSAELMSSCADKMADPHERDAALSQLEDFWKAKKQLIGLTVPKNQLDQTSTIIINLRTAYDAGDEVSFMRYRALLSDAADTIGRTERFSIENIF